MTLTLLKKQAATVTRTSAGSFINGEYIDGATTTFNIQCSIQPVSGYERFQMAEGDREKATAKIFSEIELNGIDEENGTPSDKITTANGETFEIMNAYNWNEQGITISFFKAFLAKVNV